MQWFLDISTKAKLLFAFGVMMALLAGAIWVGYRGITALRISQQDLYNKEFRTALDLQEIRSNQNANRAAILQMILLGKEAKQSSLEANIKQFGQGNNETLEAVLNANRADAKTISKLEEFKSLQTSYREVRDGQQIPLIYEGRTAEAAQLGTGVQADTYRKMVSIADELVEDALATASAEVAAVDQLAGQSIRQFQLMGGIALVIGALMVFFLNRMIASPLKQITQVAEQVAASDLTVNIPQENRSDEVGALTQTFRRMVENLREVTREIHEGVGVLGSSASEILASTTQMAAGATETATAVTQTTSTVEEVKQTAQISSQKAKRVSETAQKSGQISQAGMKSVEDTAAAMSRIQEQVDSIAESIVRLSEQGQAIGEIIATVNDLAEQSNLLAVNAAIEAAKAGEQGKGFAVVAQEVKNLAEQSKQATSQVRVILGDIQKATTAAVMATEQGSKAVEAGVKQSAEAGEAIRVLTESISEAALAATQIAASAQQQLVGMDQVVLAMQNIKQASTQNVASTRQSEAAAKNLHELGQKLKTLVEQYQV